MEDKFAKTFYLKTPLNRISNRFSNKKNELRIHLTLKKARHQSSLARRELNLKKFFSNHKLQVGLFSKDYLSHNLEKPTTLHDRSTQVILQSL